MARCISCGTIDPPKAIPTSTSLRFLSDETCCATCAQAKPFWLVTRDRKALELHPTKEAAKAGQKTVRERGILRGVRLLDVRPFIPA